ncbi:MAG: TIGR03905 family TSCPD domain-containing protein [Clostridiales bacterium]|nr:TIGR03905 family TSCPD domain-containing protein [Clostridiales bacterium]
MESFRPSKTCCRQIIFDVDENDVLTDVKFINGCSGNLQGIAKLAVGQNIDVLIEKLSGIICRDRTSCPDQLARALKEYKMKKAGLLPKE